jgi:hypothetical protein
VRRAYEELKLTLWKKYEHDRAPILKADAFIRKYYAGAEETLYRGRYDQNPLMERGNGLLSKFERYGKS